MKNTLLALALVGSVVLTPALAFAQDSGAVETVVATVNIYNAKMTQSGHSFTIDFDISNRVGVQPDIHYGVALMSESKGAQTTVDEEVQSEVLTLGEGEMVHKTFTYEAPAGLSGSYTLLLESKSSRNLPFAMKNLGAISLSAPAAGALSVDPATCHVAVTSGKASANQSIQNLFVVASTDTLALSCEVKNTTAASIALSSQVELRSVNAFGDLVTQAKPTTGVSLAPNESKRVEIALPGATKPQSYYSATSFSDASHTATSNTVAFRYYVSGAGAFVNSVVLDKDAYAAGDTATASVLWTRVDSSFLGGKKSDLSAVSASVSLVDGAGAVCSAAATTALSAEGLVKIALPITSACANPQLKVSLVDAAQQVLDSRDFAIKTHVTEPTGSTHSNNTLIIYAALALFVLVALGYFFYRRNKKSNIGIPTALLLGLAFLGGGVSHAQADTLYIYYNKSPPKMASVIWADVAMSSASYAAGAPMYVETYVGRDDNAQSNTLTMDTRLGGVIQELWTSDPQLFGFKNMAAGNAPASSGTVRIEGNAGPNYGGAHLDLPFTIAAPPTVNIHF